MTATPAPPREFAPGSMVLANVLRRRLCVGVGSEDGGGTGNGDLEVLRVISEDSGANTWTLQRIDLDGNLAGEPIDGFTLEELTGTDFNTGDSVLTSVSRLKLFVLSGLGGDSGGTLDHNELNNRDLADQHPIAAVTGLTLALAGKLSTGSILPVSVPITGGYFADTQVPVPPGQPGPTALNPRLQLRFRLYSDMNYSMLIGSTFLTTSTNFRNQCRVLDRTTGAASAFPSTGIQAWREYVLNDWSAMELRDFGLTGSIISVNIPGMVATGMLTTTVTPRTWSAQLYDPDETPAGPGGMWSFGVVPSSGYNP